MGRRKRVQDDDFDDSLEKSFFAKRFKPESTSGDGQTSVEQKKESTTKSNEKKENSLSDKGDKETVDRLRDKKRLKKLRQREKKIAAQKEQERLTLLREKEQKEQEKRKQEQRKRKEAEQKVPADQNTFLKTSMGVKYLDVIVGKGPIIVDRKKICCSYVLRANNKRGKLLDSGDRFAFRYGKGQVIQGWEIGLKGMRQGGRRHIIVPPKAGYGNKDIGGGKGAMLYFEVTLLQC